MLIARTVKTTTPYTMVFVLIHLVPQTRSSLVKELALTAKNSLHQSCQKEENVKELIAHKAQDFLQVDNAKLLSVIEEKNYTGLTEEEMSDVYHVMIMKILSKEFAKEESADAEMSSLFWDFAHHVVQIKEPYQF